MGTFRERLSSGEVVHGTWVMYVRTPGIVRMIGAAGLDFAFIDMQHSSFGIEIVADMCEVGRAAGVVTIVRPRDSTAHEAGRLLDVGAAGLMFSDVRSGDEIRRYQRAMSYPPMGERSVTVNSPGNDYCPDVAGVTRPLLVAQVESHEGAAAIQDILDPGLVDLIEVGRNDLAASLGVAGQTGHPLVQSVLNAVVSACRLRGVAVGVNARDPADAAELLAAGVTCLSHSTDKTLLAKQYRAMRDM